MGRKIVTRADAVNVAQSLIDESQQFFVRAGSLVDNIKALKREIAHSNPTDVRPVRAMLSQVSRQLVDFENEVKLRLASCKSVMTELQECYKER